MCGSWDEQGTTEIGSSGIVGSVRCVEGTVIGPYLEDRTVLVFAAALESLVEPLPQAPLAAPA